MNDHDRSHFRLSDVPVRLQVRVPPGLSILDRSLTESGSPAVCGRSLTEWLRALADAALADAPGGPRASPSAITLQPQLLGAIDPMCELPLYDRQLQPQLSLGLDHWQTARSFRPRSGNGRPGPGALAFTRNPPPPTYIARPSRSQLCPHVQDLGAQAVQVAC